MVIFLGDIILYIDDGLDKAKEISLNLIKNVFTQIDMEHLCRDYKTSLQEITQAKFGYIPTYTLISATGPDHKKEFIMSIVLEGKEFARASGKSKKIAQQNAALIALQKLNS